MEVEFLLVPVSLVAGVPKTCDTILRLWLAVYATCAMGFHWIQFSTERWCDQEGDDVGGDLRSVFDWLQLWILAMSG